MPTPSERDKTKIVKMLDSTKIVSLDKFRTCLIPQSCPEYEIVARLRLAPLRVARLIAELLDAGVIIKRGFRISFAELGREYPTYATATAVQRSHDFGQVDSRTEVSA